MKDRPILFNGPMVRAILSGKKTQTRRVIKGITDPVRGTATKNYYVNYRGKTWWCDSNFSFNESLLSQACPMGQQGDLLWVRETWCQGPRGGKMENGEDAVYYRADLPGNAWEGFWTPSIHMPRWASRITLEIVDVRVERLNDITGDDAESEGIERVGGTYSCSPWKNYRKGEKGEMDMHCSARERSYMTLWESINGPGSWNLNPWVWVIEFKMVKPIL